MTTPEKRLVVIVKGNQEGIFGRVVQDLSDLPPKKKTNNGMVEIQYSDTRKGWYWPKTLGDGSAHEQAFKDAQASGELCRLKVETSSSDDDSEVSPPAMRPRPRSTRAAQSVEAPAPAAVAPPPYDYDALGADDLRILTVKRVSFKWAQNQSTARYDRTAPAMRELLRDQEKDPTQWAIIAQHQAPAPKYADQTLSTGLSKGALDADTMKNWLRELRDGKAIEAFQIARQEAPLAIKHTLPTLSGTSTTNAFHFRSAIVKRLGRSATANDVKEAFLDAADELEEAWGERKMVPVGLEEVTVEDLRCSLKVLEVPEPTERQLKDEGGEISEERRVELQCNSTFYAFGLVCRNWSRKVALALGEGVADYAKKWADLKQDHHGNIGSIRDVRAAVAARIRKSRRGLHFSEGSRGEIRNHTLPMRTARKRVHRLAVTSSHLMTWGY